MTSQIISIWKRQRRLSRNFSDTPSQRCWRLFWSIVFWLKGVRVGLYGLRGGPTLGSRVWYRGRLHMISNAVSSYSLVDVKTREWIESVPRSECTPARTPLEYWRRFRHLYSWWLGNHHGNEVSCRLRGDDYSLRDIGRRR